MAVKKTIEIDVNTGDSVQEVNHLTDSIQKTEKETGQLSKVTDGLIGKIDEMSGGAITAFQGFVSGARSGIKSMGALKIAIASTGIGALVIAIGSLVSYFTQTQRGADMVSKAFAGIGATVSVLIDRVSAFGEGLFLIFSGEYEKGANKLKNSMKGVGEEIRNEYQAASDLEKALQDLEKREIALIEVTAKRERSIKELRLEAQKANKDQEKRGELLREAMKLQDELYAEEVAIAKERARIAEEQLALGESTRDDEREVAELKAEVIRLESERADRQRELQSELNGTLSVEKEVNEVIKERQRLQALDISSNKPEGVIQVDAIKRSAEEGMKELQRFAMERKQLAENTAKFEILKEEYLQDAKLNIVNSTLGAIQMIVGQNSKLGKAAGIAQALVNTYTGITEVWRTPSILPEPIATINKIASTVTVAASGFAAVKNISSVKLPAVAGGGGGAGQATPSAGTSRPAPPSFNIVGNNMANQLSQAIEQKTQPPKAYVVSRDVTSQQEMDRNIKQTATIG